MLKLVGHDPQLELKRVTFPLSAVGTQQHLNILGVGDGVPEGP